MKRNEIKSLIESYQLSCGEERSFQQFYSEAGTNLYYTDYDAYYDEFDDEFYDPAWEFIRFPASDDKLKIMVEKSVQMNIFLTYSFSVFGRLWVTAWGDWDRIRHYRRWVRKNR